MTELGLRISRLYGHSGADIVLIEGPSGTPKRVRKLATGVAIGRLREQYLIQGKMAKLVGAPFVVPKITGWVVSDAGEGYEMEFIEGISAPRYLSICDSRQLKRFGLHLTEILEYLRFQIGEPEATGGIVWGETFDKVFSVYEKLPGLDKDALYRIIYRLWRINRDIGPVPKTLYHGDFSLENIIVTKDKKLALLDPISSPIECYWQDISKLHVDLELYWYGRNGISLSKWVHAYLLHAIKDWVRLNDERYMRAHEAIILLNVLRIMPYVKDNAIRENLESYLKRN